MGSHSQGGSVVTTPSTEVRAETVIEEVAHQATITIDCALDDYQSISYGITRALGQRYQYVMVPESFTIHSDGSNVVRWTWKTRRPDVPGEEGEGR